jgi:hypothetical protein
MARFRLETQGIRNSQECKEKRIRQENQEK